MEAGTAAAKVEGTAAAELVAAVAGEVEATGEGATEVDWVADWGLGSELVAAVAKGVASEEVTEEEERAEA